MSDTLHQRQLRRGVASLLSSPLDDKEKALFLQRCEQRLNAELPIDQATKRREIRAIK